MNKYSQAFDMARKLFPALNRSNNEKSLLLKNISPCIFWDLEISKLDVNEDRNIIIERVFTRGNEKDEIILFQIYSWRKIKNTITKLYELNNRTMAYLSKIFGIKEKKFKCYGKKPYHLSYLEE